MRKMIERKRGVKENDKKGDAKVEQNKVTKLLAITLYSKSNLS